MAIIKLHMSDDVSGGSVLPGGQFSLANVTLSELLQFAYFVRENAISGGPAWLKSNHFDVVAKAPPNAPIATLRLMMQPLLAQEFKLVMHQEPRVQDAFALIVAKSGPKLRTSAGPQAPGCERSDANGKRHVDCYNMTMADFAERLPNEGSADIDRTVVDQTGIAGKYDMKLDWAWNAQIASDAPSIFEALTEQLGLKLERRKLFLPAIVVDHAERLPEN